MDIEFSCHKLSADELEPYRQYLLNIPRADTLRYYGVSLGNSTCGAAAVHLEDGEAEVRSFFIDPFVRCHGAGSALLSVIRSDVEESGAYEMSCEYSLPEDIITHMDSIWKSQGAEIDEDGEPIVRVDSSLYHEAPIIGGAFSSDYDRPKHIIPFAQLSGAALEDLSSSEEIPDYLNPARIEKEYDKLLSFASVKDGKVTAYILGGCTSPGEYSLMAAFRREGGSAGAFLSLLKAQVNACYYRNGGDFFYYLNAVTDIAEGILEKITAGNYTVYPQHEAYIEISEEEL